MGRSVVGKLCSRVNCRPQTSVISLAFAARCRHYLRSVANGRAEARRRHDLLAAQRVDTRVNSQHFLRVRIADKIRRLIR